MKIMTKPSLIATLLFALSLISVSHAQVRKGGLAINPEKNYTEALNALPPEDQAIINRLKFSRVELAPLDTRYAVFIKGSLKVTNTSSNNVISDKLVAEALLLCRNKDKEWVVIRAISKIDVNSKGTRQIEFDFKETNKEFEKACGDRKTVVLDSYLIIRYSGVPIEEIRSKPSLSEPENWWMDEGLVFNKK